jgi:hypothetical protein
MSPHLYLLKSQTLRRARRPLWRLFAEPLREWLFATGGASLANRPFREPSHRDLAGSAAACSAPGVNAGPPHSASFRCKWPR